MVAELEHPEQVDALRENDMYVESLQTAVDRGEFSLDTLPDLLVKVIAEDRWSRRWVRALQREVTFSTFAEFAATKMPAGLGASVDMLKRMCRDNTAALDALDRALQGRQGYRSDLHDNITEVPNKTTGTSADYALRKLREDAPELHERVLAGELSPHAAMVEAGFRKRTISIPATDPEKAAASIRRNMRPEDIRVLIDYLEGVS